MDGRAGGWVGGGWIDGWMREFFIRDLLCIMRVEQHVNPSGPFCVDEGKSEWHFRNRRKVEGWPDVTEILLKGS